MSNEARELAQRFGVRMCDENGMTHGEELYCLGLDDIIAMKEALAVKQEQGEPFGWYDMEHGEIRDVEWNRLKPTYEGVWRPLYTTQQQAVEKHIQVSDKGEPVAMRYDFDGYGYKYIDSGSGSDWQTRIKDAEPVYIKPQPKQEQGEPVAYPDKCPITRRDFFMLIEHPTLGLVPTYGGPFDSYTIPHMEGTADQPWHERELICHRFDHDEGYWMDDVMGVETIPMRVISEGALNELLDQKEDTTPQQRKPLTDEELEEIVKRGAENKPFHHWFARAIEAAHGIKE